MGSVVVVLGNGLEHGLGELDVAVFIFTVRVSGSGGSRQCHGQLEHGVKPSAGWGVVPGRVVDGVDVLLKPGTLRVGQRPRRRIPATRVNVELRHGWLGRGKGLACKSRSQQRCRVESVGVEVRRRGARSIVGGRGAIDQILGEPVCVSPGGSEIELRVLMDDGRPRIAQRGGGKLFKEFFARSREIGGRFYNGWLSGGVQDSRGSLLRGGWDQTRARSVEECGDGDGEGGLIDQRTCWEEHEKGEGDEERRGEGPCGGGRRETRRRYESASRVAMVLKAGFGGRAG